MREKNPIKESLHPRSKHRSNYDFEALVKTYSELSSFIVLNKTGKDSINFFDPNAVKALNKAILLHHYQINWELPESYLCPPIPSRVDYLHHVADLMASNFQNKIPRGKHITCLDIGVGANCIYPLLGAKEYGWSFIASDIDKEALVIAQNNINSNFGLNKIIKLREQENPVNIFKGIIQKEDFIDITICNPPFHASEEEANRGNIRKLQNLKGRKIAKTSLNFGGKNMELWCEGGETAFVEKMIQESKEFATNCFWFTSLISKEKNLSRAFQQLKNLEALKVETIPMQHGNKKSRILAWTFLNPDLQKKWVELKNV